MTHDHSGCRTPEYLLFWLIRRKGDMTQGSGERHRCGISELELDKNKNKQPFSTVLGREGCSRAADHKEAVTRALPLTWVHLGASAHLPSMGVALLCTCVHRLRLFEGRVPDQCPPQVQWEMHIPAFESAWPQY